MQPRNQVAAENGKLKQFQQLKDRLATEKWRAGEVPVAKILSSY